MPLSRAALPAAALRGFARKHADFRVWPRRRVPRHDGGWGLHLKAGGSIGVRVCGAKDVAGSRGPIGACSACMRILLFFVMLPCTFAIACAKSEKSSESAPAASAPVVNAPADQAALDNAKAAASKLGGATRTRLMETMTRGGFKEGVEVCSVEAQDIARKVREETGARVGRSSNRLRNSKNAPPSWVADWLKTQGERKAQGVAVMSQVVDTPQGRVARFIKPIEIEAPCLGCHGDPASIQTDVKAILAEKYPGDQATGYSLGDLRGALWAEVDVKAAQ
ncbi:MAG: DUF3365 domain-containing protein [Polyangiaceae bacterium]|nr:DUF3365 domain-containing protein [Polyangiaceae bacterium]